MVENKLKLDVKKRNVNLDIIRCMAIFSVISVHFFLNSGFYGAPVMGKRMYMMVLIRTFFMICVPLFLILSGYLASKNTLTKGYYKKIIPILVMYVLASLACLAYKKYYVGSYISLKYVILSILDFSASNYAWYVEMYIGLFLLIPFLNIVYNGLNSKRQKKVLVLTFFLLTALPTLLNIFNFNSFAWWANPTSSDVFAKIIPNYWVSIYPITYYFIGCYLKEYKINIKSHVSLILILLSVLCFGTFNYYRCYGVAFKWGSYSNFGGIESVVISVLVFIFLLNLKTEKMPKLFKVMFVKWSELAFGAYLVSYIFDSIVYPKLALVVENMIYRIDYFIIIVPIVLICSLILSYFLNLLIKIATHFKNYIIKNVVRDKI